ncbi:GNAT family N-acetyltransferase [Gallaecimonas kandeliae]|uniref:GNAT family N-acetyltransferase n=1 Tax=Gallaecimonas kandeliae TaxID=3029055 RepID=UPI0026477CC2|nr:GNAT family N-acetyltransferase [Gallaecimonas kandeliae]WKE66693.1 GNAT family N-acetyltransferase [Gallaecimonas kandeliae]
MLETPRLLLRHFTLEDVPAFLAMNADPEIVRYTGQQPLVSLEEAEAWLKAAPLADYARYGYGRLAVVDKASGQVIGFCGIKFLPEFGLPELGYRLLPAFWGQGLITEAAKVVLEHGHAELGLPHILALIHPDNNGSIRVAEKLGMVRGELAQYGGMPVWLYASVR